MFPETGRRHRRYRRNEDDMRRERRIEGIDVSHWEGDIDFREVKRAGIRFVYIKASEGTSYIDPDFERNYREARKARLKIGFYHYVTARTIEEGRAEARHFADVIRAKKYNGCPVMDFEVFGNLTKEQINEISLAFLNELAEETGKRVAIYSDANNATNTFDVRLSIYPLWIADYGVSRPDMKNHWNSWAGWQYTDSGRVEGISGRVDRNYFTEEMLYSRGAVQNDSDEPETCE